MDVKTPISVAALPLELTLAGAFCCNEAVVGKTMALEGAADGAAEGALEGAADL